MQFHKKLLLFVVILALVGFSLLVRFSDSNFAYAQSSLPGTGDELAQVNKITNPDDAEAFINPTTIKWLWRTMTSGYDLYCSSGEHAANGVCILNNFNWSNGSLWHNLIFGSVTLAICDQTVDDVMKGSATGTAKCIDPNIKVEYSYDDIHEQLARDNKDFVRMRGGFGAGYIVSDSLATLLDPNTAPVPTNLAYYFDQTLGDTIFGTPAYAAGISDDPLFSWTYLIWKTSRNIALAFFGLFLSIAGLMVMFRTKISPQVTVSIYSILPVIPFSLALTFLSYPLVAALYSLISPLFMMALAASNTWMSSMYGGSFTNLGVYILVVTAINASINGLGSLGVAGFFLTALIVASLIGIFLSIVVGLAIVAKIYISMIKTVILAPFVGLVSLVPGRQKIILNLIKHIIVDVLSLPLLLIMFTIGMSIIAYFPSIADISGGDLGKFYIYNLIGAGNGFIFLLLMGKYILGMGIIWQARKIRPTLESLFGVSPSMFGNEPKPTGGPRR